MADSDGHRRSGGSGPLPGDSQDAAAPGSSASNSYSAWYQNSSRWSAGATSGSRATDASFAPAATSFGPGGPRHELATQIPRRPRVSWWLGLLLALGFAIVVTPPITAERWLPGLGVGPVKAGEPAKVTVRVPPFAGVQTEGGKIAGGGVIVARGEVATPAQEAAARLAAASRPRGAFSYAAFFALAFVFAALFTHHMQRSTRGRLLRVQIVSLVTIAALALAIKVLMLTTAVSILVVPVALLAMVPTMALDRVVGLATGILAALITSLLVPFDVAVAILLLVQAAAAGLIVAEGPRQRWKAPLIAGLVTTLLTTATLFLITYLTRNAWPPLRDPLSSPWLAAAIGPAIAMVLAVALLPLYQLLVGEITHGKLVELEDLSHPLLRQIAERAPGTWQHSLAMANMAEIAANAIGASGRLVRVGAYFHDLGKSLQPKYFIENLGPGETSPHDQLPPEASCDAIFAHVTEGIVVARRAGLHERIVDFMHMHHGDGVLEYFWGKAQEQGNPRGLALEQFRYPGHPPQSRETAILAICDAVEAASRTLKRPEPAAIDGLVQRIVYGKLHLGQLDESGLSMADLRRINDSLRETIRHANHGRIEYPWQKAQQDASASPSKDTGTHPRLDSLDRRPRLEPAGRAAPVRPPPAEIVEDGEEMAASAPARRIVTSADRAAQPAVGAAAGAEEDLGILETAPLTPPSREMAAEAPGVAMPVPVAAPVPAPAPTPVEPAAPARMLASALVDPAARKVSENTQVGRAPAPDPRVVPERGPRETHLGRPGTPAARPRAQTGNDGARPRTPSSEVAPPPQPQAAAAQPQAGSPQPQAAAGSGLAQAQAGPRPGSTELGLALPQAGARAQRSDPAFMQAPAAPRAGSSDPALARAVRAQSSNPGLAQAQPAVRAQSSNPGLAQAQPGAAEGRTRPPPPPGAKQTPPESLFDDLDTPVMPAMLGELVRAESRADDIEPPFEEAVAPQTPTTLPGHLPRAASAHARGASPSTPPPPPDADSIISSSPPPSRRTPASPATRLPPVIGRPSQPRAEDWAGEARREDSYVGKAPWRGEPGQVDDARATGERRPPGAPPPDLGAAIDEVRITGERPAFGTVGDRRGMYRIEDAGSTEPSMPKLELPLPPPAGQEQRGWSSGLAARVDAVLLDEWANETPVVPPTKAELQALLGAPDPTRQQSIDEIEALHRAAEDLHSEPELLVPPSRRAPPPTAEVDPDQIEAAIELAPPARRGPNVVAVAKPKKPE